MSARRDKSPQKYLSTEERDEIADKVRSAQDAARRRAKKGSDFFQKYSYHIVIGVFVAICVFALVSFLIKGRPKLTTTPIIDEDEIQSHNQQGHSFTIGKNDFFENQMLVQAKTLLNNQLTNKGNLQRCATYEDSSIIPDRYSFLEQYPNCAQPIYNQGNCSLSYAIAAVSAISDRLCQQTAGKVRERLSPVAPAFCDKAFNQGCKSGFVGRTFDIARKQGLVSEKCVPFTTNATEAECNDQHTECQRFKIID